jgi:hypothetical protein
LVEGNSNIFDGNKLHFEIPLILLEDFDNVIVWFLENKNEFDPNLSI